MKIATAIAIVSNFAQAEVPARCLQPPIAEGESTDNAARNLQADAEADTAAAASVDTEFFGIKACYEKVNELDATDDKGHLLSLQFVL